MANLISIRTRIGE